MRDPWKREDKEMLSSERNPPLSRTTQPGNPTPGEEERCEEPFDTELEGLGHLLMFPNTLKPLLFQTGALLSDGAQAAPC